MNTCRGLALLAYLLAARASYLFPTWALWKSAKWTGHGQLNRWAVTIVSRPWPTYTLALSGNSRQLGGWRRWAGMLWGGGGGGLLGAHLFLHYIAEYRTNRTQSAREHILGYIFRDSLCFCSYKYRPTCVSSLNWRSIGLLRKDVLMHRPNWGFPDYARGPDGQGQLFYANKLDKTTAFFYFLHTVKICRSTQYEWYEF